PYKVKTGFVAGIAEKLVTSDQCDILVYDPAESQPMYRIEEFVVVPFHAARLAIEVRSRLSVHEGGRDRKTKPSGLDQMFRVCASMRAFPTPVFGFAYDGVGFDDFVAGVAARVRGDIFNVPECIVVHKKNYASLRVTERAARPNPPLPDPRLCIAINFRQP